MNSKLTQKQTKTFRADNFRIDGGAGTMKVVIRWDDQCGNGHNSFSITADIYRDSRHWCGGCCHNDIELYMPELAHLIKWHHMTSEGPMHYIENTTYHASDKDCWGLRKGESRQIVNGRTKLPAWKSAVINDSGKYVDVGRRTIDAADKPENDGNIEFIPWCRLGEGKEPNLAAARSCAIWPNATLEQLQDKDALKKRLPALMDEFKAVIESIGFEV